MPPRRAAAAAAKAAEAAPAPVTNGTKSRKRAAPEEETVEAPAPTKRARGAAKAKEVKEEAPKEEKKKRELKKPAKKEAKETFVKEEKKVEKKVEKKDTKDIKDTKEIKDTKDTKAAPAKKAKAAPVAKSIPKKSILNPTPTEKLNVYVFGEGESGELGLGTKNSQGVTRPRLNPFLKAEEVGVVALAAGGMHSIALTHDSKIFTWGVNDHGALGRNTDWEGGMRDMDAEDSGSDSDDDSDSGLNPIESTPTAIPSEKFPAGTEFAAVSAGDSSSFALTTDGLVYGWGSFRDNNGNLAFTIIDGKIVQKQIDPLLIAGLKDITQISAGGDFMLALDKNGNVFAWGIYQQSQTGRRVVERHRNLSLLPSHVALPKKKIAFIYAATDHSFAIDTSGDTWAWGSNNFAQTGITDGAGEDGNVVIAPKKVDSLVGLDMLKVQGGSHHSLGLTKDGKVYIWGRIDGAQGGLDLNTLPLKDPKKVIVLDGRPRILLEPTILNLLPAAADIAAGSDHNVVITRDGQAYAWGFNTSYQCGVGHSDDVAIATLINNNAVREKKLTMAGAGAQYSIVAGPVGAVGVVANGNGTNGTNGTH